MRGPRYRFPDEVRSTARAMSARMIREETIAATPEEMDAWISEREEVREPLVRGGYGAAFDASDLFPLLQVFLGPAAVPPPEAVPPPRSPRSPRVLWVAAGVATLLLILFVVALSR